MKKYAIFYLILILFADSVSGDESPVGIEFTTPPTFNKKGLIVELYNRSKKDILIETHCYPIVALEIQVGKEWQRLDPFPGREMNCQRTIEAFPFNKKEMWVLEHKKIYQNSHPALQTGIYRFSALVLFDLREEGRKPNAKWIFSKSFPMKF